VLVTLDRERLEAPLKNVAAPAVFRPKPCRIRRLGPLHCSAPRSDLTVLQDEMEMIRHQTVGQKSNAVLAPHPGKQLDECGVVESIQKQPRASVTAIQHVVAMAGLQASL
jgi:hypothetical protein